MSEDGRQVRAGKDRRQMAMMLLVGAHSYRRGQKQTVPIGTTDAIASARRRVASFQASPNRRSGRAHREY